MEYTQLDQALKFGNITMTYGVVEYVLRTTYYGSYSQDRWYPLFPELERLRSLYEALSRSS